MTDHRDIAEKLRDKMAEKMLEMLDSDEVTAAEMSVIRQFLKDNNVTYDLIPEGSALADLVKDFPFDIDSEEARH
jgi:hypothetical protein